MGGPPSPVSAEVHADSVVIDLHADTLMWMRRGYDLFTRHTPPLPFAAFGFHLDLPRMVEGGLDAQVFGLVTWPFGLDGQWDSARRQVALLHDCAARRPADLVVVTRADEILAARRAGQRAALLGLEGVHALEGDLDRLDALAAQGLRLVGLTHFTANAAAFPAVGLGRRAGEGLTAFGAEVVDRARALGLIVDLAHVNPAGFRDALARARGPVVVSHTGIQGAHRHWRNLEDAQIRAVADAGGVIGILFAVNYLGWRGGLGTVVRHLAHCRDVGGAGCVALGSDFDGAIVPIPGLRDVTALPRLTEALLRHSWSAPDIRKCLGENVLRVLRDVPPRAGATS
jgi:membrane dipeptidase